jgi:glucokinase
MRLSAWPVDNQSPSAKGDSQLFALCQGDLELIDARLVIQAARQGDPLARQVVERAAEYFALGIFNLVMLFFPELIVLSGGVMRSSDLFMPTIQRILKSADPYLPTSQLRILPAQLGYYAGIYGAAYAILGRIVIPG